MIKEKEDGRNWQEYNEELVLRGEFYFNPAFLETWSEEIRQMNAGKVGEPYLYPASMIEFLGTLHAKNFDFRALEGFMRTLSKMNGNFPVIDYSTICRRVNKLDIDFEIDEENLIVAIDGSGEKSSKRGGWMREKWKVKKGWIKVVIMGTKNKKGKKVVVDIRVGNEDLDERAASRGMLRDSSKKIDKAIMDGLHDCRDTFNLCEKEKIETAIKIRKGASRRARGSPRRRKEVMKYQELGHKKWVKEVGYGARWPLSEGIFSAVTRIFGDSVSSTKKRNMYHEAKLKYWAYNRLQNIK
jgi:hypothetical protein